MPSSALAFDLPVMAAAGVACLPIFFTGRLVARWEGALFLAYYGAYVAYLVLAASGSGVARVFSAAMLSFAVPLTAVTLLALTLRARRRPGARSSRDKRSRAGV